MAATGCAVSCQLITGKWHQLPALGHADLSYRQMAVYARGGGLHATCRLYL